MKKHFEDKNLLEKIKHLEDEFRLLKLSTTQIAKKIEDDFFSLEHEINYIKVKIDAKEPFKKHDGDAGYDLFAYIDNPEKKLIIPPMTHAKISTGIAISLENSSVGLIHDRSSMASKKIITMGGVIDEPYTGEISVLLMNLNTSESYEIKHEDKIAQILIQPIVKVKFNLVTELKTTNRGNNGFGSTGK